jgi:hypothetical protein
MKGKLQRIDGNSKLVKICIDALNLIRLITRNSFNELVVTQDGEKYLENPAVLKISKNYGIWSAPNI